MPLFAGGNAYVGGAFGAKRPAVGQPAQFAAKKARVGVAVAPQATGGIVYRGEVRFQDPASCYQAVTLHGTEFKGAIITVEADERSKDASKILIGGLTGEHTWQDLKDFFAACGTVIFANIKQVVDVPGVGQVRFPSAEIAQHALLLDGTELNGYAIGIAQHTGSKDGTKLQITNLAPGIEWQALKDFFINNGLHPSFVAATSGGGFSIGEVRYEAESHAATAMATLNGSVLAGGTLVCEVDATNAAKLHVTGLCPGTEWQQVKDHFSQIGPVAFCDVTPADGKPGAQGGMAGLGAGGLMGLMGGMGGGKAGGGMGQMLQNQMMMMAGGGGSLPGVGQVRFPTAEVAQYALLLNGQPLGEYALDISMHPSSKDGTKLHIANLAPGIQWQQLKDFFVGHGLQPNFVEASDGSSTSVAEVRYEAEAHANIAMRLLNGTQLEGGTLSCVQDTTNGAKIHVTGVSPVSKWQQVKDHFAQVGPVAFCDVTKGGKEAGGAAGTVAAALGGMMGGGGGGGGKGAAGQAAQAQQMMMQQMMQMMGLVPGGMGGMGGMGALGAMVTGGVAKPGGGNKAAIGAGMGGKGGGGGGTIGEIRYHAAAHAQGAVAVLDQSDLQGASISVTLDTSSPDGTKVCVTGLTPGTQWQQLKDHFAQVGQVAFSQVS